MNQTIATQTGQSTNIKRSWPAAYKAFLMDKDESLVLKIAPIALLLGSPEIVMSNLIPVVGELLDIGTFTLAGLVALRTYTSVKKHR